MSFLDPYDRDSRLPLVWRMRLALLAMALAVALAALGAWAWLGG